MIPSSCKTALTGQKRWLRTRQNRTHGLQTAFGASTKPRFQPVMACFFWVLLDVKEHAGQGIALGWKIKCDFFR